MFLPRPETTSGGDQADKAEQRRLAMTYRKCPEFAVGHGTGVHAICADGDPMRAVEIITAAVPSYEIPFTDVPSPGTRSRPALARRTRAGHEAAGRAGCARPGGRADVRWPPGTGPGSASRRPGSAIRPATSPATPRMRPTLWRRPGRPRTASRPGSRILSANESALAAFRFANQAMYLQRVHTLAAEARNRDNSLSLDDALAAVDEPKNHSWRPFQLAFVLLNLPGLADPTHPERADGSTALADLLWFPTGGGKTEAYLGLTAFVLGDPPAAGHRRRARRPGRRGRAHAVHAAAADDPAVPAGRGPGLRVRDDPPW